MSTLILGYQDVRSALSPAACAEAMSTVLAAGARGEAYNSLRSIMLVDGARGFMGLMPAWSAGRSADSPGALTADGSTVSPGAFGLKALCLIPDNPARGLDTHQGTVTLFDGVTGLPTAILNASAVTEIRTAAVTAVATRSLARKDARALAILGAGVQARSHLRALTAAHEFDRIALYAPTAAHAEAVARDFASGARGFDAGLAVCPSAREAVEGADIVVTVTSSREPVLERAWLAAGAHVNAVGASTRGSRELDVQTVADCALFCDSRESLRHEAGEFRLAIEQGAIAGVEHVRAELGEVLAGQHPGRRDDRELTVFRSLGIGIEDLAAAQVAVDAARRLGLGIEVTL